MRTVDAVAEWLEAAGTTHYYGYAGGAVWPLLDALVDRPELRGVQAKHESHAVHQADIHYRTTGRVAAVIVTKGPGLLNCVGGVASAMHDGIPLLVIAGSGPTHFMGKGGMQELFYAGFDDAVPVFKPVTKGAWLAVRPDTVIDLLNHALRVATSGRPGPVLIQLPLDVQLGEVEGQVEPPVRRSVRQRTRVDAADVTEAGRLLAAAERPVLLVGGGLVRSPGGAQALQAVAEQRGVPVVTSLPGKGLLGEEHPLSLGCVGRSGTECAARATREADLVIAVGARFSDNHTANWRKGAIYDMDITKVVQVNVDPDEIGRNYPVELGLVGDGTAFLEDLLAATDGPADAYAGWVQRVAGFRDEWRASIEPVLTAPTSPIHPGRMCYEVGEVLAQRGRVFIDIGDVIQYAEPYMTVRRPGTWHISPGMAEMGWAAQGASAACLVAPDDPAVVLTGDGAFMMGPQAVATAVEHGLPVTWVILNNLELGIERKGAVGKFGRSHPWYSFTIEATGEPYTPDFAALARSFGAEGERIEEAGQFRPALEKAVESGRPTVLDVAIDVTVPSYFTKGLDRFYPDTWGASYPSYGQLKLAR
ncbi:thiamine pyrophosphate-binding protein [Jiangella asiatica]|nr:thiamine pyrophosphate-binding protein [Jiangella asiatica]